MVISHYNIEGGWANEYLGSDKSVKFFPDSYANYWRYGFKRTEKYNTMGLKVTGVFPKARYMSFNAYDDKNFTPIDSITDINIKPDKGSINPFVEKNTYDNISKSYTIYVVPKGTTIDGAENVIYFENSIEKISIILRYYLPEYDDKGTVSLPTIEAFDTKTDKPIALPKQETKNLKPRRMMLRSGVRDSLIRNVIKPLFLLNRDNKLSSYHLSGAGMYPNKDNNYLVMPIKYKEGYLALVKFKAPKIDEDGHGDVRYYSLGQGDAESQNLMTLCDKDIKLSDDGYIYIVIGDVDQDTKDTYKQYNFMPWKCEKKMILIYRNLLSKKDFEGNMNKVPNFRESKRKSADLFIGDYAPKGKQIKIDEFLRSGFDNAEDHYIR